MRRRSLHQLDQHAAHVLRVEEDHRRAVRADPGLAEHPGALRLHLGLGGVDVGDLEADMMLASLRVSTVKGSGCSDITARRSP